MPRLVPVPTLSGGNLDVAVSTRAAIADYTTARAAFLDRLQILAAGGASELSTARAAALDRLINDLTAVRAGRLDNLDVASSTLAQRPGVQAGVTTAFAGQAAATVLCDSGALAAGDYEIIGWCGVQLTPSGWVDLEHR